MLLTTFVGLFLGAWSLLFLLDHYLRLKNIESYVKFVNRTGFVVSPFQLRIYTSNHFQRCIDSILWSRSHKIKWLADVWYFLGVGVSIFSSFFMIYLLTATFFNQISSFLRIYYTRNEPHAANTLSLNENSSNQRASSIESDYYAHYFSPTSQQTGIGIVPVVPGLNLPLSHTPLLFIILIIAGILHELGHALAACNERVTVNGFGIFVLGLYPGAFTELENDALRSLSPMRRLKIFCGGIWHNLVTALLALIGLAFLPSLLSLAYTVNKGVIVINVDKLSALQDIGGLQAGDIVYEINYCKVYDEDSWSACLLKMAKQNMGYCVPKLQSRHVTQVTRQFHMDVRANELKCCEQNASVSHLCFYYKSSTVAPNVASSSDNDNYSNPKDYGNYSKNANNLTFAYSCLPARYVTDHYACNYSKPCASGQTLCVYPALFNNTKLFRFQLDSHYVDKGQRRPPVLFIGHPRAILEHVTVSSYIPRRWISNFRTHLLSAPHWLPWVLDLFLRYLFTFSLALGLLNAVPCFTLDGQFLWAVLIDESRFCTANDSVAHNNNNSNNINTSNRRFSESLRRGFFWRRFLYLALMFYGTFMLIAVVLLGLLSFVTSPLIFG